MILLRSAVTFRQCATTGIISKLIFQCFISQAVGPIVYLCILRILRSSLWLLYCDKRVCKVTTSETEMKLFQPLKLFQNDYLFSDVEHVGKHS